MTFLIIKSDGKVYVNDAVADALSTAIECADQEQAKSIIKDNFGHDLDLMTINTNGYQYPIPGLTFEVHFKPACVLGCQRSNNYCHPAEGCEASTQRVAILHP